MVTGHNNSPLFILSVMLSFQTVLFKIFFFFFFFVKTTMTKLMDAILQNLQVLYEEQIEKSNIQ